LTATNTPSPSPLNSVGDLLTLERQLREEMAVGRVYDTHVHNCTLHTGVHRQRLYGCEAIVAEWFSHLHGLSNQQLGEHSAFSGAGNLPADRGQQLVSHAQIAAVHSGETFLGPASGQTVSFRSQCIWHIGNGRVLETWHFTDRLHLALQLGLNPQQLAQILAPSLPQTKTRPQWQPGELASAGGQTGPRHCELSTDQAPPLLANWVDALNFRRLDRLAQLYLESTPIQMPGGRSLAGPREATRFWLSLLAALPDCSVQIQQWVYDPKAQQLGCTWLLSGHHTGPGLVPAPSGRRLYLNGISEWQFQEGKIRAEWTLFDELDLIAQCHAPQQGQPNRL